MQDADAIIAAGIKPRTDPLGPRTAARAQGVCAHVLWHATWRRRTPVGKRRGGRHHRRAVHRRAGHPAHHAYVPHRRRCRRRISRRVFRVLKSCSRHASPRRPQPSAEISGVDRPLRSPSAPRSRQSTSSIRRTGDMQFLPARVVFRHPCDRWAGGRAGRSSSTKVRINPHDILRILEVRVQCMTI